MPDLKLMEEILALDTLADQQIATAKTLLDDYIKEPYTGQPNAPAGAILDEIIEHVRAARAARQAAARKARALAATVNVTTN